MTLFKQFGTESTNFFKVGISIPCHTSRRLSFSSFWLLGCFFLSCRSTSSHKCSIGFKSGENEGQWSRSAPFLFSQSATMAALRFGSLSCWKIQSWLMPNFSTDFSKLFSKISRYDSPVILPSIKIKSSTHDDEKQAQYLTLPPPCLTVGMVHSGPNSSLGKRHTTTFPSDPKRLNLLSSD